MWARMKSKDWQPGRVPLEQPALSEKDPPLRQQPHKLLACGVEMERSDCDYKRATSYTTSVLVGTSDWGPCALYTVIFTSTKQAVYTPAAHPFFDQGESEEPCSGEVIQVNSKPSGKIQSFVHVIDSFSLGCAITSNQQHQHNRNPDISKAERIWGKQASSQGYGVCDSQRSHFFAFYVP